MTGPSQEEAKAVLQEYNGLYSRFQTRTSPDQPLLLAHYTSVEVAEKILRDEEVWLANPLYVNDLGEMRTGIGLGSQLFPEFAQQAGALPNRNRHLVEMFNHYMAHLATEAALDTYIFASASTIHGGIWTVYFRCGESTEEKEMGPLLCSTLKKSDITRIVR